MENLIFCAVVLMVLWFSKPRLKVVFDRLLEESLNFQSDWIILSKNSNE